jgi:transcriptional regulator of arginine metabolism
MCVITTKPGYASAVSTIIDSRKSKDILGSIAGDNNIILILHEEASHQEVLTQMQQLFPTLAHL